MAVKFRDYYETLGVSRTASQDDIKSAFRKLARKYHPDVATDKKTAEEKFKGINEAYEVLGDPEKRRKYDQLGADWQQGESFRPPPGWERATGGVRGPGGGGDFHFEGTGFSDFFEAFFGSGSGVGGARWETAGGGGGGGFARRGSDVEADLMVTLEEALHGSKRTVTLQRSGRGDTETYQVKVPPGVREGQRIRLSGRGEKGVGGADAGDLFLRVRLARHPDYRVQGADLFYDLALAPWEAVLGCTVSVPTLSGPATLKIPPGTQPGRRMRLRGLGLPERGGGRGDFNAVVTVVTPEAISGSERELWEKLAEASQFHPRG